MRMSESQRFGLDWEIWVLNELHKRAWKDAHLVSDYFAGVDIMLGSVPIEVKAALPKKHWAGGCCRHRWQFDVSRLPRWSDSVVIMVAVDRETAYPFVCPSWLLFDRHNIHITSHPNCYRGRLACCLNNWANVNLVQQMHSRYAGQASLWEMGTGDKPAETLNVYKKLANTRIQAGLSPVPIGVEL